MQTGHLQQATAPAPGPRRSCDVPRPAQLVRLRLVASELAAFGRLGALSELDAAACDRLFGDGGVGAAGSGSAVGIGGTASTGATAGLRSDASSGCESMSSGSRSRGLGRTSSHL